MADKIAKRGVSIYIDGKEVANSVKAISGEMRKLTNEQAKMTMGADNYVAHGKKIEYLKSLLVEHKDYQKQIAKEYGNMEKAADKYSKNTEGGFSKLANGFNKYFAIFTAGLAAVTGLTLGLKKFIDMRNELEQSSASLKAITGLDDKSVAWMRQYAKELSTTTTEAGVRITATSKEIMDGFTVIGSKRPELLKNKEAMADVTKQALTLAATGVPVETAFEVVTASMNQFNLTGKDANRIINSIAAGSLEGSAEADSLAGSLKNVGTVANDSNMTLEDTVAMLEVLASKQLVGEEAGTKLRGALLKLKDAGVGYASGQFNVRDAIIEVNQQMAKKANALQRDALLQKIFGAENITAGTILLQNVDAYDKLRVAVYGTDVAMRQAKIQTSTISAQLAQAQNRFNELGMELVQNLNPAMLKATNFGNNFMKMLIETPKWLSENKGLLISFAGAMGIYAMWIGVITIAQRKKTIEESISLSLTKARTMADLAWCAVQQTLAGNFKTAGKAMKALNAEMSGTGYIAIAIAIASITVGIYKLVTAQTDVNKALTEFNKEAITQKRELNNIFEAYKKANPQTAEKARLLTIIKEKYGDYIKGLINEKGEITDIEKAQKLANTALSQSIALKIKNKYIDEYTSKEIENQAELMTKIRDRIKDSKGDSIADVIVGEIGDVMTKNINDPMIKGLPEVQKILSKYGLMSGVFDKRAFTEMTNSLASSYYHIGQKTKEFDAVFKGLVGDVSTVASAADGGGSTTDKPTKPPIGDKPDNKETEKSLENELLKEQILLKKMYSENEKTKEEYDTAMLSLEVKYTTKKRDLYKAGSDEYNKQQDKLYDIDIKRNLDANTAHITSIEESYKSINEATVAFEQSEKDRLQKELDDKLISQDDYDKQLLQNEELMCQARLNNAKAYSELIGDATFNSEADKKKAVEAATKAVEAANDAYLKAKGKGLKSDGKAESIRQSNLEKMRQQLGLDQEKEGYLQSLNALKAYLKENEATERQSAEAILAFKKQKAVEYAQIAVDITNGLSSFIQASNQAQVDSLEASKQKELKAAGNNSKKREEIEKKYAEKELDLKKKQASANMVIAIAQATAEGALGIAKIWAQSGINPIYAGIMSALLAGVTAMQIGAAVAQNDAIQNTSLGYYDGGYHTPEGYTGGTDPREVRGVFPDGQPYHGDEFIANHKTTRNREVRPVLDLIDSAQKLGTASSLTRADISKALRLSPGYSDGGYRGSNTPVSPNYNDGGGDTMSMAEIAAAINRLNDRLDSGIEANVSMSGKNGIDENVKKFNKYKENAKG